MPSSEYASVARGALKLKGKSNKVHKSKKDKKEKSSKELEHALQRTASDSAHDSEPATQLTHQKSQDPDAPETDSPAEEALLQDNQREKEAEKEDLKTESEKRFAEIKRKRLKELAESAKGRPDLLKTHKQRVEELNSHLSRLSEHHDMPKIGPG